MHLAGAILMTVLRSVCIVAALMALLFGGYLLVSEGGSSVLEGLETPERLDELDHAGREHTEQLGARHAESVVYVARRQALQTRLKRERASWREQLDEEVQAIEDAAQEQIARVEASLEESQRAVSESVSRLESQYCDSWNPVNWWTCRAIKNRAASLQDRADVQRRAIEDGIENLERRAREDAQAYREDAERRLEEHTADFERQLQESLTAIEELEGQRVALQREMEEMRREEAVLREKNWLWIEFRHRWPKLLLVALLIFLAPFLRRALWYYAGMPLVSRAAPIELSPKPTTEKPAATGSIQCGDSQRTLDLELPAGHRLLARPGYIQSDRRGARSELFFDPAAPNLSYVSGLVLLTRLESHTAADDARRVMLGAPDEPDAYLMRVDLEDHPGVVLRARHVVGVIGDVKIDSTWRLANLHAWATSQVRFIVFSGTGTLILEGYGDIHGRHLDDGREQKRMSRVVGFDTGLQYQTERTATFLPYLIDPSREPLVVDVFSGTGTVFFEKNPSARKRHRTTGEAIAGFFLDSFRRLLGL